MHAKADLPQFRALPLNPRSVSVGGAIHLVAVGGPLAVIHEDTEAREWRSGTFEGEAGLVVSEGGWCGGGAEGCGARAGGTPP